MQLFGVVVFFLGWAADILVCVLRNQPTDFHETSLGLMFGFLAGLSGFTLYGRITDRKTDYGYVDKLNEGKRIEAQKVLTPQVNTGDNANVNVTATMPIPRVSGAVPVQPAQVPYQPPMMDGFGNRLSEQDDPGLA